MHLLTVSLSFAQLLNAKR